MSKENNQIKKPEEQEVDMPIPEKRNVVSGMSITMGKKGIQVGGAIGQVLAQYKNLIDQQQEEIDLLKTTVKEILEKLEK